MYSLTSQKIRLSTAVVSASLDSLKSLQFDSMSDLIFMSWMDFFATLSCQREKRSCPMLQVIENLRSSVELNSRVRIWAGVSVGIRFLRPAKRTAPASWLSLQSNMACCRVSISLPVHWEQLNRGRTQKLYMKWLLHTIEKKKI